MQGEAIFGICVADDEIVIAVNARGCARTLVDILKRELEEALKTGNIPVGCLIACSSSMIRVLSSSDLIPWECLRITDSEKSSADLCNDWPEEVPLCIIRRAMVNGPLIEVGGVATLLL